MSGEIDKLQARISALEADLNPLLERRRELWRQREDIVANRVKQAHAGHAYFADDELRYAAFDRCACGAGLAYPKDVGAWGEAAAWDCSDILTGRALHKDHPEHKTHTVPLAFSFYKIKSEDQPSAGGATTRRAAS